MRQTEKLDITVIRTLECHPGFNDRELTDILFSSRDSTRYINQICRSLECQGRLSRRIREDGLIGNWLIGETAAGANEKGDAADLLNFLPERKMKQIVEDYLTGQGWQIDRRLNPNRRLDLLAHKNSQRWIIKMKGHGRPVMEPAVSFVSALGEIIQRMDDFSFKYSIALPDISPYRRLWERLPPAAKKRTGITALFVSPDGLVTESYEKGS